MARERSFKPWLFVVAVACACGPATNTNPQKPSEPQKAEKGAPTGASVSALIGSAGGSLKSADGRFELVVPPGALAADTMLRMTPITNTAPLGVGGALRLEPDGTQFAKPAKLVFAHRGSLDGTSADQLFAATHGADGFWQRSGTLTHDSAAKTATAELAHFSDWTFAACAMLSIDNFVLSPGVEATASLVEQCDEPATQTGPLGAMRAMPSPVEWALEDGMGKPGPGTLTPQGTTAVIAPSGSVADPRTWVTARVTRDGRTQVYRDLIALSSMVSFVVDGRDVIVSDTPVVYTMAGKTSVSAASAAGSVSVGFGGGGVGGFASDPKGGVSVQATAGDVNYLDSYNAPCTGEPQWLTTTVSVSHANKERQFIVGSFTGTLSTRRGTTTCSSSQVDAFERVSLTGGFVARWASD